MDVVAPLVDGASDLVDVVGVLWPPLVRLKDFEALGCGAAFGYPFVGLCVHAGDEVGGVDPEGWHGFGWCVAVALGACEVFGEGLVEAGLVEGGGAVDGGSGCGEAGD